MISSNFCHHILITKTPFIFPKWLAFCRYYILFAKAISFLNMSLVLQMQKFSDIRTIGWIWLHILSPHHPSFTAFVSLGIFCVFELLCCLPLWQYLCYVLLFIYWCEGSCMYHCACVEVWEQILGIDPPLLWCGFQSVNSESQGCRPGPLLTSQGMDLFWPQCFSL